MSLHKLHEKAVTALVCHWIQSVSFTAHTVKSRPQQYIDRFL